MSYIWTHQIQDLRVTESRAVADHYGSAEMLYGQFRKQFVASSPGATPPIGCTKLCLFRTPSVPITRAFVEDAVRERITRMKGDGLDMLQIHWQDYADSGYLDLLRHLVDIKRERTQRLDAIGLVNFDSTRLEEISAMFGSDDIVSNQVQVCGEGRAEYGALLTRSVVLPH